MSIGDVAPEFLCQLGGGRKEEGRREGGREGGREEEGRGEIRTGGRERLEQNNVSFDNGVCEGECPDPHSDNVATNSERLWQAKLQTLIEIQRLCF